MSARAADGYTVATDLADALIAAGTTARAAHRAVGERVLAAERANRPLEESDVRALGIPGAPIDARASVAAKRTSGSTSPAAVAAAIDATDAHLGRLRAS